METFDFLLLSGSLCGVMMVLGGILLLYKGAISLNNASDEEAFTVEFKKELRISTQYPALGIFIIGLIFVSISVWQGKPDIQKLVVKAKLMDITEPVTIKLEAGSWNSKFKYNSEVAETFYPNVDSFIVVFSAPGYEVHKETIQVSSLNNSTADLGNINLNQTIAKSQISGGVVKVAPNGLNSISRESTGKFGGAK